MDITILETDQLYLLEMEVVRDQRLTIGKLGEFDFSKGSYAYIGSAKRHIKSRILRHLNLDKVKRWHMDYLRPHAKITKVITLPLHLGECKLREFIELHYAGVMVTKGFGSSDCRCDAHLLKLPSSFKEDGHLVRKAWQIYPQ